ncbi:MAG: ABC transporter permease [Caldilineaceae bacterium]
MRSISGNPSRTWMLALRNSVRAPERLLLTLLTLMLGGALFMGVLATARSFDRTLDRLLTQQNAMDSLLVFEDVERAGRVVPLAESHPDVTAAEAWYSEKAGMTLPDGSELEMSVLGVPQDTAFYRPDLADGVWLSHGAPDGIVLNVDWAAAAGVGVGDSVTLTLGDVESTWQVVGLNRELSMAGAQDFAAVHSYVSFGAISRVLGRVDRTQSLRVGYTVHDAASQARITDELVDLLESEGVSVFSVQTIAQIEQRADNLYSILITVLLVMSLLMAVVGGLGLMGMMAINVMERRKEIGVMRAIGAGDVAVLQIFWGESMVVALLSYVLAVVGSVPIGRFMSRAIGLSFLKMPLDFAYAWPSLWLWLAIIAVIGTVASILPAWSAARLSVRESLSYE